MAEAVVTGQGKRVLWEMGSEGGFRVLIVTLDYCPVCGERTVRAATVVQCPKCGPVGYPLMPPVDTLQRRDARCEI